MAEVHVIGELVGGSDFQSGNLFCKWGLSQGGGWRVLEGLTEGQTQVDHPQVIQFRVWYISGKGMLNILEYLKRGYQILYLTRLFSHYSKYIARARIFCMGIFGVEVRNILGYLAPLSIISEAYN